MNRKTIALVFAGAVAFSGLADVTTYFVAKDDPAAADTNPGTEAAPFKTIQAAVDKAAAGDVIRVKPGVYDEGGRDYTWTHDAVEYTSRDRVCIDKTLTLEATSDDPADTVIKGTWDANPPDGNKAGVGPNAVRCVRVIGSDTVDVIVKGFTLEDGAAHEWGSTDNAAGYPGGFSSNNARCRAYFTDGVIRHCSGARGGAMRLATAVRTHIDGNTSTLGNGSGRDSKFFHCLFTRVDSPLMNCRLVNCTIAETSSRYDALNNSCRLYNTICSLPGTFAEGCATDAKYRAVSSQLPLVYNETYDVNCSYGDDRPFVAPAEGDYRVRAESTAATLGSAALYPIAIADFEYNAAIPAAVDVYMSLDGVTIDPTSGAAVAAGAFQKTVETTGKAVVFAVPLKVNGYLASVADAYVFATEDRLSVEAEPSGEAPIVYATRDNAVGGTAFADRDGVLRLGFPFGQDVATVSAVFAQQVLYVNPNGVDDAAAKRGQSAEMPYETLQYAINQLTGPGVIYASAGTFQKGGAELYGVTNRVAGFSKSFRLVGAGAGQSFIYGHYDDESDTKSGDGRGAAAVRCVALQGGNVAIQGFTLGEGYVRYNPQDPTENAQSYIGGLVFSNCSAPDWNHQIVECSLGGGVAYRGAVAQGCNFVRCRFTGSTSLGGGVLRGARLANCLYTGSKLAAIDVNCTIYNSTLVDGVEAGNVPSQATSIINSVVFGNGGKGTYGDKVQGCVVWKAGSFNGSEANTNVETDPVFVAAATGDYRVGSTSSAIGIAVGEAVSANLAPYDLNGVLRRPIAGRPVVGAFAEPLQEISISTDTTYGTLVVTGGTTGHNFVEEGETVTVTYAAGATRRPIGFRVNGEEVLSEPPRYVFTAAGVTEALTLTVAPLYSKDWYVNCDASIGDDGHDGFTPATALKTLAATANLKLLSGDTVHVARGTYAEEDMPCVIDTATEVRCRVSVPEGVTFVGDEGAEKTIILGGSEIRPASVASAGTLKGFTLTGANLSSAYGGGFKGYVATAERTDMTKWAVVRACIITNNIAARGGAGVGGVAVSCIAKGNKGVSSSGAFYQSRVYGTYVGASAQNGSGQLFRYCYGCANSTLDDATGTITDGLSGTLDSCIVLAKGSAVTASNCIFLRGTYTGTVTDPDNTCRWIDSAAEAKLVDGVPAKDSPATDRGAVSADLLALLDGTDAFGGQRVYNGMIDIGAGEYDWRGDFKSDLQGGGFAVTAADPAVVETAGDKVLVRDGALTLGDWTLQPAGRNRATLVANVTGGGTLSVLTNGAVYAELVKADGEQTLKVKGFPTAVSDTLRLVYEKDGSDTDALGAEICSVTALPPGMLLIVR